MAVESEGLLGDGGGVAVLDGLLAGYTARSGSGRRSKRLPVVETALSGFEFWEAAAFLFHQVEFDSAGVFAGRDDFLPG